MISEIVKWFWVALIVVGMMQTIIDVGKPRAATTSGAVAWTIFMSGLLLASILYFWR